MEFLNITAGGTYSYH